MQMIIHNHFVKHITNVVNLVLVERFKIAVVYFLVNLDQINPTAKVKICHRIKKSPDGTAGQYQINHLGQLFNFATLGGGVAQVVNLVGNNGGFTPINDLNPLGFEDDAFGTSGS